MALRSISALLSLAVAAPLFAATLEGDRLHLDGVLIGENLYRATLRHRGEEIFELESAGPAEPGASIDARYNGTRGNAVVPELAVGGVAVPAELYLLDNGTFMANTRVSSGGNTNNYNREANVPPMCYTKTEGRFNPCYTCHQNTISGVGHENRMGDGGLQGDYTFSDVAVTNRWRNLFIDRSDAVAGISDEEILAYINEENYSALAPALEASGFTGWVPDLADLHDPAAVFANDGFARDGSHWVAFNYKPLPSTFWPTNGSTDDVMIRLPEAFRVDADGNYSKPIYRANLAIVEAAVKRLGSVSVAPLNESEVGVDLNGDGELGTIERIDRPNRYVGGAADTAVVTFLYPEGTEFLHTVRYIGVGDAGNISNAPRMKELRYMVKERFYAKSMLGAFYDEENFEKEQGMYPYYNDLIDRGVDNSFGWRLQAFIEDAEGALRPQSYEESFFCMGCHTSIGGTIDKTFSFARKVEGADGWGYVNLRGMRDVPALGEEEGEFVAYLRRVGGGDEFRQNGEMMERWFHADGTLNEEAVNATADIYELITPSRARALNLNKAYRVIVREQSYIRGRDATVTPATNVYSEVSLESVPTLPPELHVERDIRLDWSE